MPRTPIVYNLVIQSVVHSFGRIALDSHSKPSSRQTHQGRQNGSLDVLICTEYFHQHIFLCTQNTLYNNSFWYGVHHSAIRTCTSNKSIKNSKEKYPWRQTLLTLNSSFLTFISISSDVFIHYNANKVAIYEFVFNSLLSPASSRLFFIFIFFARCFQLIQVRCHSTKYIIIFTFVTAVIFTLYYYTSLLLLKINFHCDNFLLLSHASVRQSWIETYIIISELLSERGQRSTVQMTSSKLLWMPSSFNTASKKKLKLSHLI